LPSLGHASAVEATYILIRRDCNCGAGKLTRSVDARLEAKMNEVNRAKLSEMIATGRLWSVREAT
jgi:hypothetical protein